MSLRIAVIGTGAMGRNHARLLADIPGASLAAVADADPAAARAVADAYRVPARSFDEILRDASIDGLVLATPTVTHHDLAIRALEAGKHVLVEKPIAAEVKDARAMADAARKADRVLAVGHVERHNPAVRYAREALAAGEWGKLITVTTRRVSNFPGRIRDVGVILDIGIHDLDAIQYLVGAPPKRVSADGGTFTPGLAFEDHAAILLAFPGGVTGLLEVNWLTPMKVRKLAITASEAYVELDYMTQQVRVSTSRFTGVSEGNLFQVPLELSERTTTLRRQEPLRLELEDFVGAIRERRAPLVTAEDGLTVLRVARAAIESARTRAAVEL